MFIHSFIKYLLGIYYVLDPILDGGSIGVQKTDKLSVLMRHILEHEDRGEVK